MATIRAGTSTVLSPTPLPMLITPTSHHFNSDWQCQLIVTTRFYPREAGIQDTIYMCLLGTCTQTRHVYMGAVLLTPVLVVLSSRLTHQPYLQRGQALLVDMKSFSPTILKVSQHKPATCVSFIPLIKLKTIKFVDEDLGCKWIGWNGNASSRRY